MSITWLAAILYGLLLNAVIAPRMGDESSEYMMLFILFVLLVYVPTIMAISWLWNRPELGTLHIGKVVILWLSLAAVGFLTSQVDFALSFFSLTAMGPPLMAFTWSWLSAREHP